MLLTLFLSGPSFSCFWPADPAFLSLCRSKLGSLLTSLFCFVLHRQICALLILCSWFFVPRIVGMAGIGETLLLTAMCCLCTFITSLSLSAIATNGAMKVSGFCTVLESDCIVFQKQNVLFGRNDCVSMKQPGSNVPCSAFVAGCIEARRQTFSLLLLPMNTYRKFMALMKSGCRESEKRRSFVSARCPG